MTRTSPILIATLVLGCMLELVPRAWGQDQDEDGPALGVARVSLINGEVTARRGDSGDWIEAEVNLPLVEGDSIATGRASRAEVQLDYSNLLRLHEEARLNLAELANRRFRVQLEQGVVTYSELQDGESDIDIETALVAVRPRKRGQYRVEVFGDQRVIVTVREGEAEIASADGIETVKEGHSIIVRAGAAGTEFQNAKAEPKDDWDRWNERRDDQLRKSESRRYVSNSVYGAEDLDGHGNWTYVSGYGRSWFPSVAVGWAPYRHGRWVWLDYYGWSWVGYEPWGWAPYHYGRWFHHAGHGWGWYPGPRYSRHHWRPGLVSFFGYGGHGGIGFGIGFGNIGWVPLAPGERYHPWYGRRYHDGYGRGGGHNTTIFVDNSVNIVNNYRNARHHNGVTVVEGNRFGDRGNGGRAATERDFDGASVMRGQLPIVPGRENQGRIVRAGNGRGGDDQREGAGATTFVSSGGATRSVERTSFERQQEQIRTSVRSFGESSQGVNGNPGAGIAATDGTRSQRDRSSDSGSTGAAPNQTPARAGIRSGPEIRGGSGEATTPGAGSPQTSGATRSTQRSRTSRTTQDADSSGGFRSGGQGFPSASPPRSSRSGESNSTVTPGTGGGAASTSEGGDRTRSRFVGGTESQGSWRNFGETGSRASRSSDSPARVDSSGAQAEPERRSSSRGFARSEPRVDTSGQTGISSSPRDSSRSRPSREQSPSAREPGSSGGSEVFAPRSGSRVDESSRGSRSRSTVTPDSGPSGVREQDGGRSMQTRPSREASPGATSRPSPSRSQSGISSSGSRGGSGRSSMSGGGMSGGSRSGGSMSGGSMGRSSSATRASASRGSMSSGGGGGGGRSSGGSGGGGGGGSISGGGGSRGGRGR